MRTDVPATGPRAHPDHDLLADLAAEVLPDDLAARVRAHVDRCDDCADLLAQAAGVRDLLRADEPGPIPSDVAERLDAVLVQLQSGALVETSEVADDPEVEARWNAVAHEPIAAWESQPARRRPPRDAGQRVARLRRVTGGPSRERRTALDEQRSDERVGRWRRGVLAAAAAVVVVGGGGALVRVVADTPFGEEVASSAGASGDSGAAAPEPQSAAESEADSATKGTGAVVLQTGQDYTDAAFAAQTRQLIAAARAPQSTPGPVAPQGGQDLGSRSSAEATAGNQTLRDPAALQACLTALGATAVQPVAVDLARYQGRESAILVVRSVSGTYEVWVVARDCRPGADGTLKYATITP